uniref:Uncharacterized protein n=1 Tax=Ditylenchus dipsaci TaxID=166011 RepID=A0A915DJW4_9BILA
MSSRLSSSRTRSRDRRHSKKSNRKSRSRSRSRVRSSRRKPSKSGKRSIVRSPTNDVSNIADELKAAGEDLGENLVVAHLSKAAMDWLEEKVVEQVTERVKVFDDLVRERVEKAKLEMKAMLRAQVEREMKEEVEAIEKREIDSKDRCQALDQELQEKLKSVEESENKLDQARLKMLEVKASWKWKKQPCSKKEKP